MTLRLAAAAAAASLIAVPALAGGLNQPVAPTTPVVAPAPVLPAPALPQAGNWTGFYAGGQLSYGFNVGSDDLEDSYDGALYGVHAGYQQNVGRFVLGAELDYDWTDISIGEADTSIDNIGRLKLRAGWDAGRVMPYVTGGFARAELSGGIDETVNGGFLGAGVSYLVTDNVMVGAEVLQHRFNDVGPGDINVDATTVGLRASFRF
ncbi:outer membrane protein [Rubellimicrobium sp. CFH 75288]|uniref:outer membrane protein n=1 Tax=Rubellimicrobium sp. CFH 75288 TaxID=2697034 RepID=UPI001412054D|nr:outer membrane beta-barrel protein [Rubellimicrobium sp. CFH 75288]NAZ35223.1 outer membrane beta-barrel protein [Rubellimicrobium sp. CFH 75288]